MYLNKEIETISKEDLQKIQITRLQKALEAASSTPYYKKIFSKNKVNISAIKTVEHIKDLPFTTKHDLRLSYPDGMVAVDKSEVVRIHASSGTTGKSTVIFYTANDLDSWTNQVARALYSTGVRKNDVFQNMMFFKPFIDTSYFYHSSGHVIILK